MTKFLALLSLFLFLPSRKILKCPVRTSSTNLRLQHIILQLKNIRINPPLESVLSLTTFIQNAAICSSILTTLLFSFFKPVLRPTVRIMQQSSEEGERTLLPTDFKIFAHARTNESYAALLYFCAPFGTRLFAAHL